MNNNDLQFEAILVIYDEYLDCHKVATHKQSLLADKMYYTLVELRKECDLYKQTEIKRPEDYIKEE